MADRLTPERRSWNMSRIRCRNTSPEIRVRSMLHRMGLRFSLKRKDLPGKPDIVLSSRKIAVFVHGCFWHRHENCANSVTPKTRTQFWVSKLESNVKRDRNNAMALRKMGWRILVIWECELKDEMKLSQRIRELLEPTDVQQ